VAGGIPDEVRRLIAEHIYSVEQLEVLLLLHRERREWTADEVSAELVTQRDSVSDRLDDLARRGFLAASAESPPHYRYEPGDRARERAVAGLADAYARRRVSVIALIFSKPSETIRSFSDAFRLRGDR
jgi:predicted ArsR family transcriptional regulator